MRLPALVIAPTQTEVFGRDGALVVAPWHAHVDAHKIGEVRVPVFLAVINNA